jgi:hypothetical protein
MHWSIKPHFHAGPMVLDSFHNWTYTVLVHYITIQLHVANKVQLALSPHLCTVFISLIFVKLFLIFAWPCYLDWKNSLNACSHAIYQFWKWIHNIFKILIDDCGRARHKPRHQGQWPWCRLWWPCALKNSFQIFHLPRSCPAEMALKMGALQFSYVTPCCGIVNWLLMYHISTYPIAEHRT